MKTKNNHFKWVMLALFGALVAAPNPTIMRMNVVDTDPIYFVMLRYIAVALVCIPVILMTRKKLTRKGVKASIISGFFTAFTLTFFSLALEQSPANYVVVLMLLTPVVFIALSSKIIKEKISHRAMAGITIAMLGAFTVIAAPITIAQDAAVQFYPLATAFMVLQSVGFAFAMIWMRKANEAGTPIASVIGLQAIIASFITGALFLVFGDHARTEIHPGLILAILYSGLVVALFIRCLNVLAYEKIGSVTVAGMSYIDILIAFIIPIIILGEKLSPTTVVGGIIILIGVYIIEYRKIHIHRGVHHAHRHH